MGRNPSKKFQRNLPKEQQTQTPPTYVETPVPEYKPRPGEFITDAIGVGSTLNFSLDIWSPKSGIETKKYSETAIHPSVVPALRFQAESPFKLGFFFKPQNDYKKFPQFEENDKRVIDAIWHQINSMERESFTNILKAIFMDALVYGHSVSEKVFKWDGRFQCVSDIKVHSPYEFDYYTDNGFNLDRIYYGKTGLYIERKFFPKYVQVTYPYLRHGRFFGSSILQPIYYVVKLIEVLEQAQASGIRRLAIRPILHTVVPKDKNAAEVERVTSILYNADSGSVLQLPGVQNPDTGEIQAIHKIEVLEDRASPDGTALIADVLEVLYKRVGRVLDMPDDLGFSADGEVGSRAKSAEQTPLREESIGTNRNFIEDYSNRQIVPSMVDYNFPSLAENPFWKRPRLTFGSDDTEVDVQKATFYTDLTEAGILHPVHDLEFIREDVGLPPPTVEHLKELEEQPVEAEEGMEEEPASPGLLKRVGKFLKRNGNGN